MADSLALRVARERIAALPRYNGLAAKHAGPPGQQFVERDDVLHILDGVANDEDRRSEAQDTAASSGLLKLARDHMRHADFCGAGWVDAETSPHCICGTTEAIVKVDAALANKEEHGG